MQECFALLVDSVLALQRENKEILWGSMVKETMKRKKPSFNETYYGFRTFSHLLEDAQRRGIVTLRARPALGQLHHRGPRIRGEHDRPSAALSVARPATAAQPKVAQLPARTPEPAAAIAAEAREGTNGARPRRRRSRGRRGRPAAAAPGSAEAAAESALDDGDDLGRRRRLLHRCRWRGRRALVRGRPGVRGGARSRPRGRITRADAETAASAPAKSAEPERHSFSLFSWIRRDTAPAPEAPPPTDIRKTDPAD